MRPIIEFCTNNMHHGTDALMERLEQNPEVDVVEYGCLGNCGLCYLYPYAMVNGEVIEAETVEQLSDKIDAILHELESQYDWLDDLDLGDD